MAASELACSYAVLILYDDGIAITAEKISTLLKKANVSVESYWPSLFAKLAGKRNIEDIILNAGSGGPSAAAVAAPAAGAGAGAGAGAAAAAEPAAEEKKEEPKEESDDDDMGFSLFD